MRPHAVWAGHVGGLGLPATVAMGNPLGTCRVGRRACHLKPLAMGTPAPGPEGQGPFCA